MRITVNEHGNALSLVLTHLFCYPDDLSGRLGGSFVAHEFVEPPEDLVMPLIAVGRSRKNKTHKV